MFFPASWYLLFLWCKQSVFVFMAKSIPHARRQSSWSIPSRKRQRPSFPLGSQVLNLPQGQGPTFGFQFGHTLRDSQDSALAPPARRARTGAVCGRFFPCVSAAEEIGWDLSQGHLFPTVTGDGTHGELPPTAAQMPECLQQHLRVTGICRPNTSCTPSGSGAI